jgi:hypothetical protein
MPGWTREEGRTEDIIVRHMRVRGVHNIARPGQGGDAFNCFRGNRAIVDHCSFTGSMDEMVDAIHSANITFQWCTIEEPALWGQGGNQHGEGSHNYGMILAYDGFNATVHHCLFTYCAKRCPSASISPCDMRNNVVYGGGPITSDGGSPFFTADKPARWNIIGCTFRPARRLEPPRQKYDIAANRPHTQVYAADNDFQAFGGFVDPWDIRERGGDRGIFNRGHREPMYGNPEKLDKPAPCPPVTTHSAEEGYKLVLARAGAWPRDATTRRIVREVRTQSGEAGLSGPYERFPTRSDGPTSRKFDADRDGMPDAWERARGLDPADPTDGNRVVRPGESPGDRHAGYTYVEYFLNELADQIVAAPGRLCTVEAAVEGEGLIICEHGGRTADWQIDPEKKSPQWRQRARGRLGYNGYPLEVAWGPKNTFNKGSIVTLRALPQGQLGVTAPVVSKFSHWSGGPVQGVKDPEIRLVIDRDMKITAHFKPR